MLKHSIVLITLSIVIVLFMPYGQQSVQLLIDAHEWISELLTNVFSGGQAGNLARGLLALLTIPVLVGLIPAVIYWIVRRHFFPYFMEIVWVVWLIQVGALLAVYQVVTPV